MDNEKWKKYFYVSLVFNIVVIFSFIFFSFIASNKGPSTTQYKYPLSKAQEAAIETKRQLFTETADSIWTDVGRERLRLWKELLQNPPDSSLMDSTIDNIISKELVVRMSTYQYFLTQMFILTPQQRTERITRLIARYQKRHKNQ